MGQQMSLDTDAIQAAYNKISGEVSDLKSELNQFLGLLNEKVNDTQGNMPIIATLETRLKDEAANVDQLVATCEEINNVTRRYIQQAEEAADDSAFAE